MLIIEFALLYVYFTFLYTAFTRTSLYRHLKRSL